MKTSIKTLVLLFIISLVLGFTSLAFASSNVVNLPIKNIKKINVSGNVELIVVQGVNEGVSVYNDYYLNNALVQKEDDELRITSYQKEKLAVVVTVAQLQKINASGDVKVSTHSKVYFLGLELNLSGKSTAEIDVDVVKLTTKVYDQSKLVLKGSSDEYFGMMSSFATLNMDKFSSENTQIKSQEKLYYALNRL